MSKDVYHHSASNDRFGEKKTENLKMFEGSSQARKGQDHSNR